MSRTALDAQPTPTEKAASRWWPRPGGWTVLLIVALTLSVEELYRAAGRTPAGPAAGTEFHSSWPTGHRPELNLSRARNAPFRVGTFNIHGGMGLDRRRDLRRVAACLTAMAFVGLNEVHGRDLSTRVDQAEALGRQLDRSWLFAPTERRWWHEQFGNGALFESQVHCWQRIPLDTEGSTTGRNALLVSFDFDDRRLTALVTHIDRREPQRTNQLRTVVDLFLSLSPPAILLGDMNSTAADPTIQRLLTAPGAVDALAGTAAGQERIDWIVSRGLKSTGCGMLPAGASDHPCFWADFILPDTTSPQASGN
jgi:endonuclease/exonuclease/phosphatase family metal-dependent hydrolase